MKNIVGLLFIIMTFFSSLSHAQDTGNSNGKNVIVKYKKYESFDLGNLEIKGQIIAPGDLTVKERARKVFRRDLFDRFNFNPEIKGDVKNLR